MENGRLKDDWWKERYLIAVMDESGAIVATGRLMKPKKAERAVKAMGKLQAVVLPPGDPLNPVFA